MDFSITIVKTANGYYCKPSSDSEENDVVFQQLEEDLKGEQLTVKQLFYYLMDYFGVFGNKHENNGEGQYLTIKVDGEK